MSMHKTLTAAGLAVLVLIGTPASVFAWGDGGHRMVGEAALRALPASMPAFLRSPAAILDVGEYSREPDLWRGSGVVHDAERDPAHFITLADDGLTLAGVTLENLPATRSDYEAALRARGIVPAKAGYLPYSTLDAWQQIAKDMAYWRVISLAESRETDPARRAWLAAMRLRRENLMLRDIGLLSHYVGDATQPMHLSLHSNGWGDYPNPAGFTTAAIHWPIEGVYTRDHVTAEAVQSKMSAYTACDTTQATCIARRLMRNFAQLEPLYRLEKAGGFKGADPRGPAFLTGLLARGASDLRDDLVDAWTQSVSVGVGHEQVPCADLLSGHVDLYALLYGDS
ncbi:hypothetical protein [Asticcacaulis sp. 201]|uniref:hypothetical protein n=1 Tax=Asticcacaulis sp. 201 TaxID=3028787 RepID=UPI002915E0AC|nr:hypothetical protein [Asticcacaulis sp. 201]MDV6330762.1 hypothetical protein [Asticcacaulis sp. 201]